MKKQIIIKTPEGWKHISMSEGYAIWKNKNNK